MGYYCRSWGWYIKKIDLSNAFNQIQEYDELIKIVLE